MLNPVTKGGYAEYATVNADDVAPIPSAMSFETAAALPTASLTGLQLVESVIDVQAAQRILITGALGAVGRIAVFAALERGAEVIAGVRDSHVAAAIAAGASGSSTFPR